MSRGGVSGVREGEKRVEGDLGAEEKGTGREGRKEVQLSSSLPAPKLDDELD